MGENEYTKKNRDRGLLVQTIHAAGLNVFALRLLIESYTHLPDPVPVSFPFLGVNVALSLCKDKGKKPDPKWTVVYNITSPESEKWVGTGWEFFDLEKEASEAYQRHVNLDNCPTKRPFHIDDRKHLGACHHN